MQVTYNVSRGDYKRLVAYIRRQLPTRHLNWLLWLFAVLFVGVVPLIMAAEHEGEFALFFVIYFVLCVSIVGTVLLLGWIFTWLGTALTYAFSEHLKNERTLEIGPKGIRVRGPSDDYSASWTAVRAVGSDQNALYFLIGRGAGLAVPRRCFATAEESEQFFEAARTYKRDAEPRWSLNDSASGPGLA